MRNNAEITYRNNDTGIYKFIIFILILAVAVLSVMLVYNTLKIEEPIEEEQSDIITLDYENYTITINHDIATIDSKHPNGLLFAGISDDEMMGYIKDKTSYWKSSKNNYTSFSNLFNEYNIKELVLCGNIKQIMGNTFKDCLALESVVFNCNVEFIGAYAFDNTNITKFELPGTIKELGEDCLNPAKLERIILLPNESGEETFISCFNVTNAEGTTQNMNYYTSKYKALKYVECFGKTRVGYMGFRDCTSLESVIFHNSTYIDAWAFQGCTNLKLLDLTGVYYIDEVAIQCCESLLSLYIPSTLTKMEKWVLDGSYNLKYIYIEHKTKPNGWHNEWPGTIRFNYQPKTPTMANYTRQWVDTTTEIHWGCTKDDLIGTETEYINKKN